MIDRREILDIASRLSLNPHVVEKDYVLGWMLAGIYANPELRESWVFKGGTCLKKCFFETYRFSEDLDFTLLDPAHIDEIFLKRVFAEIGQWIYDETGILAPANMQEFDIYSNPRGSLSCQGKVSYRGPVSPQGKTIPRIFVSNLITSMKKEPAASGSLSRIRYARLNWAISSCTSTISARWKRTPRSFGGCRRFGCSRGRSEGEVVN